jgi:hypothetical protein
MTGPDIVELVRKKIRPDWRSISIDGSAFDSSQFASLMRVVDNYFWQRMRPFVEEIIQHNWGSFSLSPLVSVEQLTENMM